MRTDIYEVLDKICEYPRGKVLATIIDVAGSSYKKAGSTMLFLEDNHQIGLLSGGCLEQDLKARIKDFWNEPTSTVVTYDLSSKDDLSWGQGAGCNGIIKVAIESITPLFLNDLKRVRNLVNNGKAVTHIKRISSSYQSIEYLFCTEGEIFGQWQGELPNVHSISEGTLDYKKEKKSYLFKQEILARPRLFIYGAGVDSIPLANLAHYGGYQVIIVDWRPAFCNPSLFPFACQTLNATPSEFVQSFSFSSADSIILMTHNYEKDTQLIHLFLTKKVGYVGLLGSKKRAEIILKGVKVPEWIHYPVGLAIGAEGPQEIAVSIIAELIQSKARRGAKPLEENNWDLSCCRTKYSYGNM